MSAAMIKSKVIPNTIPDVFQVIVASWFLGICAQVKIPLFFTPVPLTIQTSAVMLIGAFLGSRKGGVALICYLIQGSVGFPLFAGGASGMAHIFGPTGGYLLAYVVQVHLVGRFIHRAHDSSLNKTLGILLLSVFLQLGIGSLWLGQFVSLEKCFALGFYPFILTEIARAILVSIYLNYGEKQ